MQARSHALARPPLVSVRLLGVERVEGGFGPRCAGCDRRYHSKSRGRATILSRPRIQTAVLQRVLSRLRASCDCPNRRYSGRCGPRHDRQHAGCNYRRARDDCGFLRMLLDYLRALLDSVSYGLSADHGAMPDGLSPYLDTLSDRVRALRYGLPALLDSVSDCLGSVLRTLSYDLGSLGDCLCALMNSLANGLCAVGQGVLGSGALLLELAGYGVHLLAHPNTPHLAR